MKKYRGTLLSLEGIFQESFELEAQSLRAAKSEMTRICNPGRFEIYEDGEALPSATKYGNKKWVTF